MQHPKVFRIEYYNGSWFVLNPDPSTQKVAIDTALVDTLKARPGCVEGYIVSVHGLDMEQAKHLERATLHTLGVAAQIRRNPPPMGGLTRIQLLPDGQFERVWNR